MTHGDDAETEEKKVGLNEDDENYDAEEDMMELLGFKGFDSTKVMSQTHSVCITLSYDSIVSYTEGKSC